MIKKVLITGGAGFIGSNLVAKLLKKGLVVVVIDNLNKYYDPQRKRHNLKKYHGETNFSFYRASILTKKTLEDIFRREKPMKIVHLAADVGVRPSFERAEQYIQTNVVGTQIILDLAVKYGVEQFILASSSSVYGKRKGRQGFEEGDDPAPISPYAATKLSAEFLCQVYAKAYKLKTTVLRFFTVYGENNRPDMAAFKFVDNISRGKLITLFGRGTKRDFTYVDDVAEGIELALRKPFAYQVINLGNSHPISVLMLIRLLERSLGKKAKIKRLPLPPGDVPVTFANNSKAKKLLGWRPTTPIEIGVNKLVTWYSQSHSL